MDFGIGESAEPFVEELCAEHEIPLSPADQDWDLSELFQALLDLGDHPIAGVAVHQGDVLDKAQDRDAILHRVVGLQVQLLHLGRQWAPLAADPRRSPAEGVETQDQKGSKVRVPAQPEGPREALGRGEMESGRVQDHETLDALRMADRIAHPDHPAPVVQNQRGVLPNAERFQ